MDENLYRDVGDELLHSIFQEDDYIAYYGRLGMKWYQHIFGEYQGAAKYAKKGVDINAKLGEKFMSSKNPRKRNKLWNKMAKNERVINEATKLKDELFKGYVKNGYTGKDSKLADDVGKAMNEEGQYYTKTRYDSSFGPITKSEYTVKPVSKEWAESNLKSKIYEEQTKAIEAARPKTLKRSIAQ